MRRGFRGNGSEHQEHKFRDNGLRVAGSAVPIILGTLLLGMIPRAGRRGAVAGYLAGDPADDGAASGRGLGLRRREQNPL
jgi:hypothetical protein